MEDPLLAKSWGGPIALAPRPRTLVGHTACVLSAVAALFGPDGAPTRLAKSWLRFFGLEEAAFARFLRHLRVAAAVHDWGKANDGFQGAVKGQDEQVVRHEHLSGLLLGELIADPAILAWLRDAGIDEVILLAAVISHHLKVGSRKGEVHRLGALMGRVDTLRLLSSHVDFATIWRMFQDEVGLTCPSSPPFTARWRSDDIAKKSEAMIKRLDDHARRLRDDRRRTGWVAAVRAAMIVADAAGSAVVRMDNAAGEEAEVVLDRWVGGCFSRILGGHEVWTEVTKRRIADLRDRGRWKDSEGFAFGDERGFNRFQVELPDQGRRVLLTTPCGSGKTLAAWNWIKAQLDQAPASRVLFLYPTRATATEGFRDYVSWAPGCDAGLLSGTADYELQDLFETPDDSSDSRDPRKSRDYRTDPRLYALGNWKKRIFSATADQFFPFMQYKYGPICHLPLLIDSVLVVDEVHSFDESMFSTLRHFLKEFPTVPVLCMTATLPAERARALADCGLTHYPETTQAEPTDDSDYPRYHVEWIDRKEADALVFRELNARRRILWVSNRVRDCRGVLERHRGDDEISDVPIRTFCYHSRFTLDDRKGRHKSLIGAFQEAAERTDAVEGLLGATTQVCEMSLDLDAEILVTELAPMASLIQRMGRCNRDSRKLRKRPIGRVYVLKPRDDNEKPYEKSELDAAEGFVDKLAGKDVSQRQLEAVYKDCDPNKVEPMKFCPFLDSGPYADSGQDTFRDSDDFTVPCILDCHRQRVLGEIAAGEPIDGFIVPVPRYRAIRHDHETSRLPRWLSIAEAWRYDPLAGFDEYKDPISDGDRD